MVYEAATIPATFDVASRNVTPQIGAHDLPSGDLSVHYSLGSAGKKTLIFDDAGLRVSIEHRGAFVEQLPLLLLATDSLVGAPGQITVQRGASQFSIHWASSSRATVTRSDEFVGSRRVVVVAIPGSNALTYDFRFRP